METNHVNSLMTMTTLHGMASSAELSFLFPVILCECTCMCARAYVSTRVHVCAYVCIHTCVCACVRVCISVYMFACGLSTICRTLGLLFRLTVKFVANILIHRLRLGLHSRTKLGPNASTDSSYVISIKYQAHTRPHSFLHGFTCLCTWVCACSTLSLSHTMHKHTRADVEW